MSLQGLFRHGGTQLMALIGYARVSTREQVLDLQMDALNEAGCERIFIDEGVSGAKAEREGLTEALNYLREGDTLVVWKFDRLGRSVKNLLNLMDDVLKPRKIEFRSLTEQIDTNTPLGKMFFTITAAFAEMERSLAIERSRKGMEAARARGRVGGRPAVLTAEQKHAIRVLHSSRSVPPKDIAKQFNISRATLYKALKDTEPVLAAV